MSLMSPNYMPAVQHIIHVVLDESLAPQKYKVYNLLAVADRKMRNDYFINFECFIAGEYYDMNECPIGNKFS